jgi:hypothetical protein
MNKLLFKLFGKQIQGDQNKADTILEPQQGSFNDIVTNDAIPSQDLFADYTPPNYQKKNLQEIKSEKPVKEFLDRNHEAKGRMAGFECHTHDMLSIYLKDMRTEFRYSLDRMIQLAEMELLDLHSRKIEVGEDVPSMREKLDLQINQMARTIDEMRLNKELSVEDEGLIASPIQSFTKGYRLGMQDYFEQKSHFDFSIL